MRWRRRTAAVAKAVSLGEAFVDEGDTLSSRWKKMTSVVEVEHELSKAASPTFGEDLRSGLELRFS